MHPPSKSGQWSSLPAAIREAAGLLWDYHRLGREPEQADGILVFGSNDLRVAEHAASLFEAGMGPWILFSGARGRMTQDWKETEAESMARVARDAGVPPSAILVEDRATHTGENIRFSQELLVAAGIEPSKLIVVQKPYMERRTLAALDVQWPGVSFQVTSPPLDIESYCSGELSPRVVIEAMVGDFQRIIEYPALGFASAQPAPVEAREAFEWLVDAGFSSQLR